ncbi:hypothetical protein JJB11_02410 [Ramlibacter ginsenosidimutans]|uniref:DUF4189 domain-containing protein n=1 Tax=Ramlibacter ginsenosidimutans TaxID=502333 RepID=A0A934TPG2_9BURK|nr:hypothetical protein [Ramlibacter ginsenosidimutans]MBK6004933.1 hypothetical protein [Ramlibacter ginsenosidimutans]
MRGIRRVVFLAFGVAVAVLASGCASVAGGNTQKMAVQVRTADGAAVEGAECSLTNDKGNWHVRAPGDTTVVRSYNAMQVRCERVSLPQGIVSVESGVRAAMFGNILIGGAIGAMVDHTSGAAYEYPEQVRVVMGRTSTFTLPRGTAPGGYEPAPSGFAAVQEVDVVPHLSERGREAYRDWLKRPQPRAFALSPEGHYASIWGTRPPDATLPSDPKERALVVCERRAKKPCQLYAVNDKVVWEAQTAAARPVLTSASSAALVPAAPATVSTTSTVVARAQPGFIASGYAAVEDVDALPYLSDRGRAEYREWLLRPTPKAFAISEKGHWWAAWSLSPKDASMPTDPNERALVACQRNAGIPCKLYAVNGSVVWKP